MLISVSQYDPPDEENEHSIVGIPLAERRGPVSTLSVERYPIKVGDETLELTAHYSPHNKNMSLAVVMDRQLIGRFLFCCPHPCELSFRLPSTKRIRIFCDPAK
jgi:hypothetical protein